LISESPFLPNEAIFFGDYTNISVHGDIVRPIWTRLHNNQLSVWTALIDMKNMHVDIPAIKVEENETKIFPNPSVDEVVFSYKIRKDDVINLCIYDNYGKKLKSIMNRKNVSPGMYIERFSAKQLGLSSGVYLFVLESKNGVVRTSKFVVN
jgi:hypothetical protein